MADDLEPPAPPPSPFRPLAPLEFKTGRKFTLEADFFRIFAGEVEPPNFKPIEHWQALHASIGLYGKTVERYEAPQKVGKYSRRTNALIGGHLGTAIYYLNCGQGGGFTGEGVVVMEYGYNPGPETTITGRFALCEHTMVEGAGANHSRGWHPGHCSKCGLDMSVDSGD